MAENVPSPAGKPAVAKGGLLSHTCSASSHPAFAGAAIVAELLAWPAPPCGAAVLAALTAEAAARRARCVRPEPGRSSVPLAAVARLAVPVEAVAVPERPVGRARPSAASSTTVSEWRTTGSSARLDAEAHEVEEARVDDARSSIGRAAVADACTVVPASGLPFLVSRRKYGCRASGPFVVTVQSLDALLPLVGLAQPPRRRGRASPFAAAMSAAQTRPAISAAMGCGRVAALVLPALLRSPRGPLRDDEVGGDFFTCA